MNALAPTLGQIRAQVSTIKSKVPNAETIGIHIHGQWTGESEVQDGESTYFIHQCESPLELRVALRQPQPRGATRVILTRLDDGDLSDDIRLRLAKRRLFRLDSWQVIQTLFQAHAVDPRVSRQTWMADQLLTHASADTCPAAPGGFLDLETVWSFLLDRAFGLSVSRPDLPALLKWSDSATNAGLFRKAEAEFQDAVIDWLVQSSDPVARLILECTRKTDGNDALPIGIAAQVIFHSSVDGKLDKTIGKLEERYLDGDSADKNLMARWGASACEVIRLQYPDTTERERVLKRADKILAELQAEEFAYLSDVSLIGFDQRLEQLGNAITDSIDHGVTELLSCKHLDVKRHFNSGTQTRRLERIEMAMRLIRCLASPESGKPVTSFSDSVRDYLKDGGFIDTARLSLRNGDAIAALSESYSAVVNKCTAQQEERARKFAKLLKDWSKSGSSDSDAVPVESVLEEVVAPLCAKTTALVVVMDGMSVAVFNQLIEEITRSNWALISQETRESVPVAIATIPSVTEFSRTSLLCGKLSSGTSATEKKGFPAHPSLLKESKAGKPPLLFHKAALHDDDDGGLSQEIRQAIASKDNRIVGVVINAIDDYLLKGDQIEVQWKPDDIKALPTLLHEAKVANRAVVLLSDHGHVLERTTKYVDGDGGDRWRELNEPIAETEMEFGGHRVMTDSGSCVVPWTESLRYAGKKNGYHGGVNPQEMLAPIAVLVPEGTHLDGWTEVVWARPDWWSDSAALKPAPPETAPKKKTKEEFPETLFEWQEQAKAKEEESSAEATPKWIEALMVGVTFEEQKSLAGRSYPKNEQSLVDVLTVLDRNGYKMTSGAISNSIDYPPMRLRGLIAVMQRVLNLDGYEVLRRDDESDMVELDLNLLRKQFEIEDE